MKNLIIISGPQGSGKTTMALEILKKFDKPYYTGLCENISIEQLNSYDAYLFDEVKTLEEIQEIARISAKFPSTFIVTTQMEGEKLFGIEKKNSKQQLTNEEQFELFKTLVDEKYKDRASLVAGTILFDVKSSDKILSMPGQIGPFKLARVLPGPVFRFIYVYVGDK